MIRKLLEKWSRGVILKRKLPKKYGSRTIYVSPEGGLRYWNPSLNSIDPMLLKVVDLFIEPNNIVWDVGTNLGYFTFTAAHLVGDQGKVLSFEPDIWLCNLLKKSIDANGDRYIDLMPMAVSNKNGIANFNISVRSRSTNYLVEGLGSTQTGGVRQTYAVPTITLDSILDYNEAPNFVKIDVEGAEHLVFEGATNLLTKIRPKIHCEVAKENYEFISSQLLQNNYDIYDAEFLPEFVIPVNPCENIIALPK